MPRKKDPEIVPYKLKDGKTYYRLKTYIGKNPETGKPVKVTRSKLQSRKEAEQLRNKLKSQGPLAVANKLKISKKRKTVAEVYEAWLESIRQDVRGSTLNRIKDTWRNHTCPEFGENYINNISPDHIQRYANELSSKYTTYKTMVNQLHRIISYAIFRHWSDNDPFDYVLIPKKSSKASRDNSKNFYELEELKEFLEVAKEYSHMKYTYFLTVSSLGCRRGEGLALQWTDIDFENKTVRIERTVTKDEFGHKTINNVKNGVKHTVEMSDHLYTVLSEYKQHCNEIGDTCNWIFHTADGSYNWSQQVDLWIRYLYRFDKRKCKEWNIKHPDNPRTPLRVITPHGLRHTLATLLYDGNPNINPKDIQYVLGHKTSKTAMEIYTHVTQKQKDDIRKSLNKLDF